MHVYIYIEHPHCLTVIAIGIDDIKGIVKRLDIIHGPEGDDQTYKERHIKQMKQLARAARAFDVSQVATARRATARTKGNQPQQGDLRTNVPKFTRIPLVGDVEPSILRCST